MTEAERKAINQGWMEYWQQVKNVPWQLENPNPSLLEHIHLLVKPSEKATIFVPLCGKSVDLLWLYQQGHNVVGIEVTTLAIEEFFSESSIDYEKSTLDNKGLLYKSKDGRLKIFNFDLFDLKREHLDGWSFDAVYDRSSFIAMEASQRVSYVEKIASLIDSGTPCLLERIDHPEDGFERPFQFTVEEIKALWGPHFEYQKLSERIDENHKVFHVKCSLMTKK